MEANILQTFWSLSSVEEEERVEAAKDLLELLEKHQGQDKEPCAELEYSTQRLVKGLSSHRKGARHGFYTALVEVLVQFPQLQVAEVLELIHKHLEPTGGAKAAEERGACFGKGFALLALCRSGVLLDSEDVESVAKQLVALGKKKVYLREFCGSVLCQLLESCSEDVCKNCVLPVLELDDGWDDCTSEQLQLILQLSQLYSQEVWFQDYLAQHWKTRHIWSRKNFSRMTSALLESSTALPRLHLVWELVLDAVRCKGHFGDFWKAVVEGGLLVSSHERRYLVFQLLEKLLPSLVPSEVGVIFSPSLLSCLLNNCNSPSNYLYSAARHLVERLTDFAGTLSDQILLTTLLVHFQMRAKGKFDQLSGSKVLEVITSRVDESGVRHLLRLYQQMLETGAADSVVTGDEEVHELRVWALEQLLSLVRNPRLPRSSPWLFSTATLLLGQAFFDLTAPTNKLPEPLAPMQVPLEPSIRENCRLKFSSILADLSAMVLPHPAQEDEGAKSSYKGGTWGVGLMEDGQHFVTALFWTAQQLMGMGGVTPSPTFSDEEKLAWENVCSAVENLLKTSCEGVDKAFLLLFSAVALELLSPLERKQHCQVIQDLESCYQEMTKVSRRKGQTPKKKQKSSQWMEVLTDLLLGLLSRSSQFWRRVVEQSFKMLTGCVTAESLQLILAVLEPRQSVEDTMETEEGKEEEEDSDDDDGDSSTGSSGSEGEEEAEVDSGFADEVRRALGSAAVDSDGESEESLDDEAMMAVDEALGEVFRTRFALKHQKKQQRDDEKSLLHFKLRVLDLVEVFIRRESSNPLVLDVLLPLFEVVLSSQSSKGHDPLVTRAGEIFTNRLCRAKEYPKLNLDKTVLHDKLHQLLEYLPKTNAVSSPLVTSGVMYLMRVLRGAGPITAGSGSQSFISPLTTRAGRKRKLEERGEEQIISEQEEELEHGLLDVGLITEWFSASLHNFITVKNSHIPPHFFTTYIQRYPSMALLLLPKMVQDLPAAASNFKKTQVLEMIAVLSSGEGEGAVSSISGLSHEDAGTVQMIIAQATKKKKARNRKHKRRN